MGRFVRYSALVLASLVGVVGCRGAECPTTATAATPPEPPAAKLTPVSKPKARAEQVLEAFAQEHPLSPTNEPLRQPKSLEDVDAILHLDQMDLFAGAAAFAEKQPGLDALALRAQIELAHSEAQLVVAEVLNGAAGNIAPVTRALQFRRASGTTSSAEQAKLIELERAQSEAEETEDALRELAADHARLGAELAKRVILASPSGHRGYRIAADYHRLRGDWPAFEEALGVLAKTNPTSNGLLFLKALEAQAEGDSAAATKLLQTALTKDGRFVRAQAHIVMLQKNPEAAHAELQRLRAMNPHHQLVVFAGSLIDAADQEWKNHAPSTGGREPRSL